MLNFHPFLKFFRKRFHLFKTIVCVMCAVVMLIPLHGCAKSGGRDIFTYAAHDAEFSLVFPSETGDLECSVVRGGNIFSLRIVSPARSSNFSAVCDGVSCKLVPLADDGTPSVEIPLSESASAPLVRIFSLITRGSEGAQVSKSADGETTVVTYSDGTVVLGSDSLPVSVTSRMADGSMRDVKIVNYTEKNALGETSAR